MGCTFAHNTSLGLDLCEGIIKHKFSRLIIVPISSHRLMSQSLIAFCVGALSPYLRLRMK